MKQNRVDEVVYGGIHRIHGTGIYLHWFQFHIVNVGKLTIHGSYGVCMIDFFDEISDPEPTIFCVRYAGKSKRE